MFRPGTCADIFQICWNRQNPNFEYQHKHKQVIVHKWVNPCLCGSLWGFINSEWSHDHLTGCFSDSTIQIPWRFSWSKFHNKSMEWDQTYIYGFCWIRKNCLHDINYMISHTIPWNPTCMFIIILWYNYNYMYMSWLYDLHSAKVT